MKNNNIDLMTLSFRILHHKEEKIIGIIRKRLGYKASKIELDVREEFNKPFKFTKNLQIREH